MFTNGPSAITVAEKKQFIEGYEHAYQQSESILDPLVDKCTQQSESDIYQRIGEAEDMREDVTRFGDNPTSDIPHDARHISLRHFELGKHIVDPKDRMVVVSDPSNAYTQALLKSGRRKRDDFIIDKYFADARTGKEGTEMVSYTRTPNDENDAKVRVGALSKGSSNPIKTGGIFTLTGAASEGVSVGANYDGTSGGTASGLTLNKLKALREAMLRIEGISEEDVIPLTITARQMRDLMNIDEVINSDYSYKKALADGTISNFHGFRFIHTERLALSQGAGGDERRCMAFLPRAFKLAIGKDLVSDLFNDSGKKNVPYILFRQSIGASRMWGELAGEIRCLED